MLLTCMFGIKDLIKFCWCAFSVVSVKRGLLSGDLVSIISPNLDINMQAIVTCAEYAVLYGNKRLHH